MKKSIFTLFAVALGYGAIAQVNTINQAAGGAGNSVTMRQYGNTKTEVTQNGNGGSVLTFQQLRNGWDWIKNNTVTINQTGSRNRAETDQLGANMSINITATGNDNTIYINQSSNSSSASFTQSGNLNSTIFLQNGQSNTFSSTQSGNGNRSELNQEVIGSSSVNLTQSGTNDIAIIRQGLNRDNSEFVWSTNNTINATQDNNSLLLTGSTLRIYQKGNNNLVGVDQIGGNNSLSINQSGSRNKLIGLSNDMGIQSGNNNTGILTQSGTDNTMKYSQVGNDTYVNSVQSGSGNTTNVVVGSYN
jgi:hypothetical protein